MPKPWFHVTWGTYGSWLPGDPRGFRDHDHRVHSSGTYDNPPPEGEHALLYQHARRNMARPAVALDADARCSVLRVVLDRAQSLGSEPLAIAVSATHVHLLARFDGERIGVEVGMVKRACSKALADRFPGGIWSRRCHPRRIRNEEHQRGAYYYIARHAGEEQAAVWTFRNPYPR